MMLTTCQSIDFSAIPEWNDDALLPFVINGYGETDFSHSSPYRCSIEAFYKRFCYTDERLELFKGLLMFRKYLYENVYSILPSIHGIQWVDGSFCQDKESSLNLPPNDIDVWTAFFYDSIPSADEKTKITALINPITVKKYFMDHFKVDAYFTTFYNDPNLFGDRMKWTAYWCGLWSHKKVTNARKGFCQLTLSPTDDRLLLNEI